MNALRKYYRNTFSSLKIRNYRLYFIGQGISLSGTWMQSIGQAWLVLNLTGSGTALGLVTALQFLPVLVLASWGGVIADRFPKRRLLFATQAAAGLLALTLAILVFSGAIRLWMVYILAASLGVVNSIDNPIRQSFVLELVGRKKLRNAVTLNSTEINLTRVIGPAIAGFIITGLGLAPCFFINAASYIAVLVCLFLMNAGEFHLMKRARSTKGQLRRGFSYVRHTPLLRDVLVMMALIGTLCYEFQVSLPLLARFTFSSNAGGYALLTSAIGIGAVLGGLLRAGKRSTAPRGLIGAAFAFGVTMLLAAISPDLPVALTAMVLVGAASISFTSLSNAVLQLGSAPEMRGRIMALWAMAFLGSTPIGGPIIGLIGEHGNPRWTLAAGAAAAIIAGTYGLLSMKRHPDAYSRDLVEPAAAPSEEMSAPEVSAPASSPS